MALEEVPCVWGQRTAQGSVHRRVPSTGRVPIDKASMDTDDVYLDKILEGSFCMVYDQDDRCTAHKGTVVIN